MTERTLTLAFESSCDETSVAVIENGTKILSNIVATQIDSHQRFGGVVPEVASRHHIEQITKCTNEALEQADVDYNDLDAVAVTYGPGLVGSLLIGVTAAKAIAWAHNLPLVPVNHMAGHIYAARYVGEFKYPQMALLVSGGHTELVYMPSEHEYQIIGETRDDAAGEAYDKIGRVLGVNYPAGKTIDEWAAKVLCTQIPQSHEKLGRNDQTDQYYLYCLPLPRRSQQGRFADLKRQRSVAVVACTVLGQRSGRYGLYHRPGSLTPPLPAGICLQSAPLRRRVRFRPAGQLHPPYRPFLAQRPVPPPLSAAGSAVTAPVARCPSFSRSL